MGRDTYDRYPHGQPLISVLRITIAPHTALDWHSYRKGRILLAGDAAHIHAPMGGQGLNVGIQDAMNLGWKLASVVRGNATEALLDSYERERWPVGEILRRNTLAQVALFCKFDPSALALRATFEDALRVREINRRLAAEGSGFGVAYPEPLLRESYHRVLAPVVLFAFGGLFSHVS